MKTLYLIGGFTTFGIGVIGIILPVLPTTPFLLLTGLLFAKGSDKYKNWFESTKTYNKFLKKLNEDKTMTFKQKWTLMIFTDIMMMISFLIIQSIAVKMVIILLVIIKYYYFGKYIKVVK